MNCTICNKPIVLSPSAEERARKFGGSAADYRALFTSHADCFIAKRSAESVALMREIGSRPKPYVVLPCG
jgi:hypothetical protein